MKLIWAQEIESGKHLVKGYNNVPFDPIHGFDSTQKELESEGAIFVESILAPEQNGKGHTHYIDPVTKKQWFEYYDLPQTDIQILQDENKQLKNSVADLWEVVLMGGK